MRLNRDWTDFEKKIAKKYDIQNFLVSSWFYDQYYLCIGQVTEEKFYVIKYNLSKETTEEINFPEFYLAKLVYDQTVIGHIFNNYKVGHE
jgi:hypothetical protein